jgi:hypothetical protein
MRLSSDYKRREIVIRGYDGKFVLDLSYFSLPEYVCAYSKEGLFL